MNKVNTYIHKIFSRMRTDKDFFMFKIISNVFTCLCFTRVNSNTMEEDKKDENKVQVNDLNTENKDGITLEDKKEGNNKKNKKEERKEKRKRIKEEKRKEAALANPSNTSSNETNNTSENNDNTENKKKRDKGAFTFKNFTVRHDLCGMKVGTDAVLLAGYLLYFISFHFIHFILFNLILMYL